MLSISTSWNHNADLDMRGWLNQIKRLGLSTIELGYTLTHNQLNNIARLIDDGEFNVSSIHNFCPLPNDGPSQRHASNYYRLSSLDQHERQKAVEWTKNTVDIAVAVGASVVIIHAGTVELEDDPSEKLFQLYKEGKRDSREYQEQKERMVKLREQQKGPYIEALNKSLKDVLGYAQIKNIKIGLETRYYPVEIPNFDEIGYLLNLFGGQGMSYWHDVGHAEINERLGLKSHLDFLKTYKSQLIGVHLHGMKGLRDHLAPFDGDMDLTQVLPFIENDVLKVIEARFATTEQLKNAVAKL